MSLFCTTVVALCSHTGNVVVVLVVTDLGVSGSDVPPLVHVMTAATVSTHPLLAATDLVALKAAYGLAALQKAGATEYAFWTVP